MFGIKLPLRAQSYDIAYLVISVIVAGAILAVMELVIFQTTFTPANQLVWEITQRPSNSQNQTVLQNATNTLWPTVLTDTNLSNNILILTGASLVIVFALPIVLSLFFSQAEPTRIVSPKQTQYVAYGILGVTIFAILRLDLLPILLVLGLFSPFTGKAQDAVVRHVIGYSGTILDMYGRAVRVNAKLENILAIFRLDKHRKRFANLSEPERVSDGVWRAKSSVREFTFYLEFRRDISEDKTIIGIIAFKKEDYAIVKDADVKELVRMRIAYLKELLSTDYAIEIVDAPPILVAALAEYAQNDIQGLVSKFSKLGRLNLYRSAGFGVVLTAASLYLISIDRIVEGLTILVPGAGYLIFDLQRRIRE